jgi:hypothetical protein
MTLEDILGSVCGFLVVIVAIFLLQNFKEKNPESDYSRCRYQKQCLLRNGSKHEYGSSVFFT